ncbi:MAG: hypothetical protein IT561_02750 [Alphaproteobacteria bacterium]|nr:hypothetical protein [Alphaproteobacteria bacterium]
MQSLAAYGGIVGASTSIFALPPAMAGAATPERPTGPVPPVQLFTPNWPDYVEIGRLVPATWKQLGIDVEVRQGTTQSLMAEVIGEHQTPHAVGVFWGGAPDRLDPDFFLTEFFHSRRAVKKGLNYGHYINPDYDAVDDAQRAEMDPGKRRDLVWKAQEILAADNPIAVLCYANLTQGYNKTRLEGVVPTLGSGIGMAYIPWSYYRMKPLTDRRLIRVATFNDIVTLNPFATPEIFNATILRWMYPTFVTRGPNGEVEPWAAEKWEIPDATTVEVTLRAGLAFHDGRPVSARDVKFTFDFIAEHKFPALARVTDTVAGVEQLSDRVVRFTLKQPVASFVPNVLGFCFIAPEHIWKDVPGRDGIASPADWPNPAPVGYGGFRFREWRKGEYLHYEANKDFFLPPQIDGTIWMVVPNIENQLAMLESGDADILGWPIDAQQAKRVNEHPDLEAVSTPSHGMHEIRFNMEMAPVSDPVFRLALQYATNRREIIDVVFGGLATAALNSVITPANAFWANPNLPNVEFSVETGRQVLADAGYTWDADGKLHYPSA